VTSEHRRATPRIIAATIDCADLDAMTHFWGSLLGVDFTTVDHFGFLAHAPERKVTIWLQKVAEPRAGKNRVHLDFVVEDLDAALDRVRDLGGEVGERQQWQEFVWRTCSDPEGNVFDIMQAQPPTEA
jgi:predicted enzyme related to lactoylglutathione lyase